MINSIQDLGHILQDSERYTAIKTGIISQGQGIKDGKLEELRIQQIVHHYLFENVKGATSNSNDFTKCVDQYYANHSHPLQIARLLNKLIKRTNFTSIKVTQKDAKHSWIIWVVQDWLLNHHPTAVEVLTQFKSQDSVYQRMRKRWWVEQGYPQKIDLKDGITNDYQFLYHLRKHPVIMQYDISNLVFIIEGCYLYNGNTLILLFVREDIGFCRNKKVYIDNLIDNEAIEGIIYAVITRKMWSKNTVNKIDICIISSLPPYNVFVHSYRVSELDINKKGKDLYEQGEALIKKSN